MMNPAIRAELIRFRMEHIRRAAEHHRATRAGHSPRRPEGHPEDLER